MTDTFEDLKNTWKDSKHKNTTTGVSVDEIIKSSQSKMRKVLLIHVYNIAILFISMIAISAFFYYVAPFKETLGRIGMTLMVGGLAVRILIELWSILKSRKIDLSASALDASRQELDFYNFRKRIHGPVTYGIMIGYIIGFYMLTPEFSKYMSTAMVIFMDASFVVIIAVIIYFIRQGTRDEVQQMEELLALNDKLNGE